MQCVCMDGSTKYVFTPALATANILTLLPIPIFDPTISRCEWCMSVRNVTKEEEKKKTKRDREKEMKQNKYKKILYI